MERQEEVTARSCYSSWGRLSLKCTAGQGIEVITASCKASVSYNGNVSLKPLACSYRPCTLGRLLTITISLR